MKYPAYPEYRPTGLNWLPQIPAAWQVHRLKWTVTSCDNGVWGDEPDGGPDDIVCLRVADFDRATFRIGTDKLTVRSVEEGQRKSRQLRAGDLLIEKSGGGDKQLVGCVVQFDHNFAAVCSNFVARMAVAPGQCSRYWAYAHAALYAGRLNYAAIKQTTGIQNLDAGEYLNLQVAYPSIAEQEHIANFLDWKTGQIDALIAKKQALLRHIDENLYASMTSVLTGKRYPQESTRPSDVAWLGPVPSHWRVMKLSRVVDSRCDGPFGSGLKSAHYVDCGVRVIRLQNIGSAEFINADAAFIDPEHYRELGDHDVLPGDLLIAGLGDRNIPVGRACVAPAGLGPAMVKADCFRYRLDARVADAQFVAYQLSISAWLLGGALASGVTRARMNLADTSDRILAFPPLDEQKLIVKELDDERAHADEVSVLVRLAINRLTEYRSALITAAVTGQIDVRGVRVPSRA